MSIRNTPPSSSNTFLTAAGLMSALDRQADARQAAVLQGFFKTGPGQYGEGDRFIGVRVPITRKLCREYLSLPLVEIQKLLDSPIHEHRLAAVILLSNQYPKADESCRRGIFKLYVANVRRGRINNWDLVDVSAEHVIGRHLLERSRSLLFRWSASPQLWERRVAIISTFAFIKRGEAGPSLELSERLLHDRHDLIQKAVGWMLREVGKRVGEKPLTDFLGQHAAEMPRTMLRYSLERLSPAQRQHYMRMH